MQVSKQKVNHLLEKQVSNIFYQMIADIKKPEEAEKIFKDILTDVEKTAITKRVAVAYWLAKKRSYGNIKNNLKLSSATIASIKEDLKKPGWKLALEKVMADEFATKWEAKIKSLIGKKS